MPFDDGSPEVAAALADTTRWGSFLDEIDVFDAEFFDISPAKPPRSIPSSACCSRSPARRWSTPAIRPIRYAARRPGFSPVHASANTGSWRSRHLGQVDAWTATGGALSIIANRLSYFLDLRGPSVAVDTACSSSLVAVHLACQSLRTGESELAIAAGVNLLLSPAVTRSFDQADAMSPTGGCHAFDAAADGIRAR